MTSQPIYSGSVEEELLEVLLQSNEITYPWNPADAEAEAYLAELERGFDLEGWSDQEISQRSHKLFVEFDNCWSKATSPVAVPAVVRELQASLSRRFAARAPQDWLEKIAQKASQLVSTQLSMGDQLVQCVEELLPHWGEDVLRVWARPYAGVMRDSVEDRVRSVDWIELSPKEQALLSLAIARKALDELKNSNP